MNDCTPLIKSLAPQVLAKGYDPNEARDEHGQWSHWKIGKTHKWGTEDGGDWEHTAGRSAIPTEVYRRSSGIHYACYDANGQRVGGGSDWSVKPTGDELAAWDAEAPSFAAHANAMLAPKPKKQALASKTLTSVSAKQEQQTPQPVKEYDFYHVVGNGYKPGDPILTRDTLAGLGNAPAWHWEDTPEGFDGDIVSLHDNRDEAEGYQREFGGRLLGIRVPKDDDRLDVYQETHPVRELQDPRLIVNAENYAGAVGGVPSSWVTVLSDHQEPGVPGGDYWGGLLESQARRMESSHVETVDAHNQWRRHRGMSSSLAHADPQVAKAVRVAKRDPLFKRYGGFMVVRTSDDKLHTLSWLESFPTEDGEHRAFRTEARYRYENGKWY